MSFLADQAERLLPAGLAAEYAEYVRHSMEWLESESWALVLTGRPGSSKTSVASALLAEFPGTGGFLDCARFVDDVRESCGSDGLNLAHYMNRADLFVLDDVGGEYATYFSNTVIERFVAECYSRRRRLVLTTNMSEGHLCEFYSERMVDRLHEDSQWLVAPDVSFRRLANG